ncbi:phosphate ABC transporter permease PstA [Aurantivibrio plasticivorans]
MNTTRFDFADYLFRYSIYCISLLMILVIAWLLGDVFIKGFSHLSWDFLVEEPRSSGRAGGIAPILTSTMLILAVALITAVPIGLSVAIWLAELTSSFGKYQQPLTGFVGSTLDVLAGIPSIVYGLFGNAFFSVYLGLGFSILSGGLTLACMILPVFIRTCESGLRAVDHHWRDGALALGMSRVTTIFHILLPTTKPAILAGLILSIGRATAETAALIFTSGYVDRSPDSLLDSGRALAVHIYDLSMNVTGGDANAYASALVLILMILIINVVVQAMLDRWFFANTRIIRSTTSTH